MKQAWTLLALLLLAWPAQAWQVAEGPRVRVLYPRPELASYATGLVREAEAALDVLAPLFGDGAQPVVVRLNPTVDWFNAYATTFPRPTVELLAPLPAGDLIDLRSASVSYLLLVHELTHTQQLGFDELPGGRKPLRLGLASERMPRMPPAWFTEGVATFMESRFTAGGRLDWALTQGLINTLMLGDDPPDLADVSLYTYRDWPGGLGKYLLGVRFVQFLVERYGWEAVLETLRQYNARLLVPPPFAAAWERASGVPLAQAWKAWTASEREHARAYADAADRYPVLADEGTTPALSPDGDRIAYASKGWILVRGLRAGPPKRLVPARPQRLWWRDERTLLYSRYVREGDGVASDVFLLDVDSGRETRLTRGLHARLAAPAPGGCFYFVQGRMGAPARLRLSCGEANRTVWEAAAGEQPVGLAVSPGGQVALAVWREGRVDLALVEDGELRYLAEGRLQVEPPAPPPSPCAGKAAGLGPCPARAGYQHLDPHWADEDTLLFRADEAGVYELYRFGFKGGRIDRLTRSLGGFTAAAVRGEALVAAELGPEGPRIVRVEATPEPVGRLTGARYLLFVGDRPAPGAVMPQRPLGGTPRRPLTKPPQPAVQHRRYAPWASLAPYGWMPTGLSPAATPPYFGLEVSLYGLDDTGVYSYRAALGFDPRLGGAPLGAYAYVQAGVGAGVDLAGPTSPLGFTLRAGAWPAGSEVGFGALPGLASAGYWDRWNWHAAVEAGPVWSATRGWWLEGRGFVRSGREERDPWGYLKRGFYAGAYAGRGYAWGLAGAAAAPWEAPLVLEGRVYGGRNPPPLSGPLVARDLTLEGRVRYRFEPELRSQDGWLALERVTLAPGLRVHRDAAGWGYGAELGLYADGTLFYFMPLPLGVRGGWDGGWWWRLELGAW